eukprot:CAMPEP_0201216950 /NCGR_PEP_ID=MMETSP0851-20130426/189804_1 /ASSEMBLY_ACC=CAM_ASM_000631 /TAXON_ID=183588 /ORGANISM="Pseudo-nitzschia fraudulenta, Strain WWA7" /LENGTH=598 /DNA_ID=CAMNT_0047506577 /DNA_START=123 /DNA_END=1919 /DNA_ORIENTATION=-
MATMATMATEEQKEEEKISPPSSRSTFAVTVQQDRVQEDHVQERVEEKAQEKVQKDVQEKVHYHTNTTNYPIESLPRAVRVEAEDDRIVVVAKPVDAEIADLEEAKINNNNNNNSNRKNDASKDKKRTRCFVVVALLVLLTVAVATGFVLAKRQQERPREPIASVVSAGNDKAPLLPQATTNTSPSGSDGSFDRREAMVSILAPLHDGGERVFDASDPGASDDRIAALEWLVEEDPARIPATNTSPSGSDGSFDRREAMVSILAPLHDGGERVFDASDPGASDDRIAALEWLVEEDPARIPVPSDLGSSGIDYEDRVFKIRQRYLLALFYEATNGETWEFGYDFLSGSDECLWTSTGSRVETEGARGAFCNDRGRLVGIVMWWNDLSGTLPGELSFFSDDLDTINVAGGSVSGTIPSSFEKLTNLETLALSDNCLTGSVPAFLADLPKLSIFLSNNNVNNLHGSMNGFCDEDDSEARRDGLVAVSADCGSGTNDTKIECDCCVCCDPESYGCTDLPTGNSWPSHYLQGFSKAGYPKSFDESRCLTSSQKEWIARECPCVEAFNTEHDRYECRTDCSGEGAIPSHGFSVDEQRDSSQSP